MPDFRYKVLDESGRTLRGNLVCESEEAALRQLNEKGCTIISVRDKKSRVVPKLLYVNSYFYRLSMNNFINFLRQFETLMKAGLPLFEALTILIEQEVDKKFQQILEDVRKNCAEGLPLADSFRRHPRIFSEFFVNMIMVGETSGDLDGALIRILKFVEEEREITNNVISALIYPTILVVAGLMISIVILVMVLPQFVTIFESAQIALPLPTLILIGISGFIRTKYLFIILFFMILFFSLRYLNKTPEGRRFFDNLKISVPVVGPLVKKLIIARLTRVLGNLDESGVPLLKALEVTQKTIGNVIVVKALDEIVSSVRDGKGIAGPMKKSRLFPPMVVAMIGVGEESGYLEKMFQEVADFYEKETFYTVKKLVALIEPLMLIVIGIGVAIMAASFLLPMFRLTALLRRR